MLLDEMKAGSLTALIARSADFYGPRARTGVPNVLVFDRLGAGKKAMWLANDATRHSFTFTPDAARALVLLAEREDGWNQTWHLPTASNPPTGRQFIELAANELGTRPRYRVLGRSIIRIAGLFDTTIRELYEMLYQYEVDYIVDSTKFAAAFGISPTAAMPSARATIATCELAPPSSSTRPRSRLRS
jgi:nucleoside-diphosphate-sugar epimerase